MGRRMKGIIFLTVNSQGEQKCSAHKCVWGSETKMTRRVAKAHHGRESKETGEGKEYFQFILFMKN